MGYKIKWNFKYKLIELKLKSNFKRKLLQLKETWEIWAYDAAHGMLLIESIMF